jgi:hypothetical protein
MKRQVIGVLTSVLAASALMAAQTNAPQTTKPTTVASEVTVTGCLTQGSGPAVFILENARQRPEDKTEKAQSYVVVAATEDMPFTANLNHEVSVTGSADAITMAPPPAGQKTAEKDMARFSAKTVTLVADRCTAAPR